LFFVLGCFYLDGGGGGSGWGDCFSEEECDGFGVSGDTDDVCRVGIPLYFEKLWLQYSEKKIGGWVVVGCYVLGLSFNIGVALFWCGTGLGELGLGVVLGMRIGGIVRK